jgi:hypothetical protein
VPAAAAAAAAYMPPFCITIQQVPIQTKMVDASLMSQEEVAWLDNYHQQVSRAANQVLPVASVCCLLQELSLTREPSLPLQDSTQHQLLPLQQPTAPQASINCKHYSL